FTKNSLTITSQGPPNPTLQTDRELLGGCRPAGGLLSTNREMDWLLRSKRHFTEFKRCAI
ncbi:MAG: hypothetical protein P1P89_23235, partial [Desulfobacterales bacterium]|nr:hypothetical protein [Desulfobacterales bacterium]